MTTRPQLNLIIGHISMIRTRVIVLYLVLNLKQYRGFSDVLEYWDT